MLQALQQSPGSYSLQSAQQQSDSSLYHSCYYLPPDKGLLLLLRFIAVSNVIMALPAAAEAGKLFDFNLTLPISE
jgi:hypothetical protein